MADATYTPKIYRKSGGDVQVVASGGEIKVETGGKITANGTQHAHVADLKVNYTTLDLDTEAEIIAAINTTNAAINTILAILEGIGANATS